MLALDIFKQVTGQQNFNKGAVVSLILLIPVLVAFVVDWIMQSRQQAQFSVRSLRIVVQKTQHFKAITLGEFTFDPDMIASPESSKTIPIGVPHIL